MPFGEFQKFYFSLNSCDMRWKPSLELLVNHTYSKITHKWYSARYHTACSQCSTWNKYAEVFWSFVATAQHELTDDSDIITKWHQYFYKAKYC